MKKYLSEFKKFIAKGNVVDLAVAVIIGGAFGKIVTSLVNDILMPIIGVILGGLDFTSLSINFRSATINYGMFIQNIVDFLIIAVCIFIFVKFVERLLPKKEVVVETPKKADDIILLEEIRDLLKDKKKPTKKEK